MPKKHLRETVLHDWVCDLTFQMQALLLTAMRGPDENNKYNAAKAIIRYLRGIVIKPAGRWYGDNDNDFMWGQYAVFQSWADTFWQDHDEYPHHFIMHLVHCAQVAGYKHPDLFIREFWFKFYMKACDAFHMNAEKEHEMNARLNDFGCGVHNLPFDTSTEWAKKEETIIYRIYKDTEEYESSSLLGGLQADVSKEEYDRWGGSKQIIKT